MRRTMYITLVVVLLSSSCFLQRDDGDGNENDANTNTTVYENHWASVCDSYKYWLLADCGCSVSLYSESQCRSNYEYYAVDDDFFDMFDECRAPFLQYGECDMSIGVSPEIVECAYYLDALSGMNPFDCLN